MKFINLINEEISLALKSGSANITGLFRAREIYINSKSELEEVKHFELDTKKISSTIFKSSAGVLGWDGTILPIISSALKTEIESQVQKYLETFNR